MSLVDVLEGKRKWWVECADVLDGLRQLPDESVHCVVTSPPYWGLRDYGVEGQIGLEPTHLEFVARMVAVFAEVRRVLRRDGTCWINLGDSYVASARGNKPGDFSTSSLTNPQRQDSIPRGGNAGRLHASYRGHHTNDPKHANGTALLMPEVQPNRMQQPGLKPKDLVGVPWRVALALQDSGWYLRSDIIWAKPNPMPESVADRPTKAHEYLFLLTRSERYAYDADAIREPVTGGAHARKSTKMPDGWDTGPGAHGSFHRNGREKGARVPGVTPKSAIPGSGIKANESFHAATADLVEMRNKRSVWTIPTQAYPEAHFATFPEGLVEPCILAGCPVDGIAFDPFAGSATVGVVALRHGRRFVGLELNPAYVEMARRRIVNDAPMWNQQPVGG